MVIQTISKNYRVIMTFSGSSQVEAYLCSDDQVASAERYLVLGLTGKELSRKLVPYFMELASRKETSDLLDCFTRAGSLWLAFRYYDCQLLLHHPERSFSQRERLEASRSLMERIMVTNLPCYLQYEVLNPDNLVVSDANEVFFNYLLMEPQLFNTCTMNEVKERLAECFEILFAPELEADVSTELPAFIEGLKTKEYSGYLAVYRDYRGFYDLFLKLQEEGRLSSRGWLIWMWEYLKKLLKQLGKLLYLAIIAGLFIYLIYLNVRKPEVPAGQFTFDQIGTFKINSGQDEETGNLK